MIKKDLVVVGAGAGGLTAAIVAAKNGLDVLLVEKDSVVGGAAAFSAGGVWAPNNTLARQAGAKDSKEGARRYVSGIIPDLRTDVLEGFLDNVPAAIDYLVSNTEVAFFVAPAPFALDYRPDVEGATREGRLLTPAPYDGRRLGDHFSMLRPPLEEFNAPGGMMLDNSDLIHLTAPLRSFSSFRHVAGLVVRHARDKLFYGRGTRLTMGNALTARLLKSAIDAGVEIWRQTPMKNLVAQDGRVVAVEIERNGAIVRIASARGVILATGGFSHDSELRQKYIPHPDVHQSIVPTANTGDGIHAAIRAGAALDSKNPQNAIYVLLSIYPRSNGTQRIWPHFFMDKTKPGFMIVNRRGQRFGNEADHYFVEHMHRCDSVPAYLIGDDKAVRKYGIGAVRPGGWGLRRLQKAGYIISEPTLSALAEKIGVDAKGLEATAANMAEYARTGTDAEFGKGTSEGDRLMGDFFHKPNPCLGALDTPPFHAVKVIPGDASTTAGLLVNGRAQVLSQDEKPIPGLYACGIDMNSPWRGISPGLGGNLTLGLTFGYIAARAACGERLPLADA